jgi:hypothetical protein
MKKTEFIFIFILTTISLLFVSYIGLNAEMKLRNASEKLNKNNIKALLSRCNFCDITFNKTGNFQNDFVDNGDGTVTDRATGLMWEQKGSKREKSYYSASKYVKKMNKKKFAGHNDWRIPTIEELYSLLEPNLSEKRYINAVFSNKPSYCWSIDDSGFADPNPILQDRKLALDYEKGTVRDVYTGTPLQGASGFQLWSSYVRAVRSVQ